ncbi:MAG: hypothetical protein IV100_04730 [Myxococcales bacterium]|nr:hypothetical protein [Myxococcales bacterium]
MGRDRCDSGRVAELNRALAAWARGSRRCWRVDGAHRDLARVVRDAGAGADAGATARVHNFPGRSGPGSVYLASPLVVAASAIAGYIVEPDRMPLTKEGQRHRPLKSAAA